MLGNYQRYEVTVKFSFDSEVFPGDPDDIFELAKLEEPTIETTLKNTFEEVEIEHITVEPIVETLA